MLEESRAEYKEPINARKIAMKGRWYTHIFASDEVAGASRATRMTRGSRPTSRVRNATEDSEKRKRMSRSIARERRQRRRRRALAVALRPASEARATRPIKSIPDLRSNSGLHSIVGAEWAGGREQRGASCACIVCGEVERVGWLAGMARGDGHSASSHTGPWQPRAEMSPRGWRAARADGGHGRIAM